MPDNPGTSRPPRGEALAALTGERVELLNILSVRARVVLAELRGLYGRLQEGLDLPLARGASLIRN